MTDERQKAYQEAYTIFGAVIGPTVARALDAPGFGWEQISEDWLNWTTEQYRDALQHPLAVAGYESDVSALRECDACVLVLPSGRSASWEFGYAMGTGKPGAVLQIGRMEPELMYREASILGSVAELQCWADQVAGWAS